MSIASRIESMTTHLQNDYDALESVVGTITEDKNIENIAPILDNLWEELPHTTGTGTSLSLATKSGKMKVNLLGNTSQTGTPTPSSPIPVNVVSGDNEVVVKNKNLYQNPNPIPKAANGNVSTTTTEYIDSNSFKINLKKTTTDNNSMFCQIPLDVNDFKPSTTYTLSKTNTIVGTQFNGAGALRTYINGNYGTTTYSDSITFTTPSTLSSFAVLFYGCHSSTQQGEATITINEIQLEENNTQTAFEPYTSTSYPIHLGGELFDYAYQVEKQYNSSGTQQSSQRYTLSNNVITISRDKSNYGRYFMNKKQLIAGNYILKFTPTLSGSDNRISFSIMDLDTQVEYDEETITITNGTEITKTFTLDTSANISINIQPYKDTSGTLTFTNVSLKSTIEEIELCKISTYQDRFFKNIPNTTDYNSDLEDNEWYLEKKIGKYTFTGNETLSLQNNGKRVYVNSTASSIPEPLHTTSTSQTFGMYSNKLVEVTAGQTWGGTQGVSYDYNSGGNTGNFDISINGISTLADYRTAVAGIILYYILQTPTYTKITGTLKDELEAVWRANSYKGTTNISQVNNDLPFNLDITALEG